MFIIFFLNTNHLPVPIYLVDWTQKDPFGAEAEHLKPRALPQPGGTAPGGRAAPKASRGEGGSPAERPG